MDYNIKIKAEGIGKAATKIRKRVLQTQGAAGVKTISPQERIVPKLKKSIKPIEGSNKKLITSLDNLTKTNKVLNKATKDNIKKRGAITEAGAKGVKTISPQEKIVPKLKKSIKPIEKKITPKLKESIEGSNKKLITSLDNLTKTNKVLNKATKDSIKKRGAITGGGAKAASVIGKGAAGPGIGGIGASLPIIGAGIAALGFTIQKINQIGNAYIELSSQQLRTVGMGGFRRGQGIYGATEMGAGIAAFARGTGRFAENVETTEKQIKAPLAIGTRYGMSAEQILGQAGTFRRAGGRIEETAAIAAGGGIQADMPVLLSGMAGILEEAIRNGIDTTDMAKDLGTGLTQLAMETPAKSAEAALSIVKSFRGVKQGVTRGKLAGFESMYVAQAGRDILMEKLTNPDVKKRAKYLQRLTESGWISERQKTKIEGMTGKSYQELTKSIGPMAAQQLVQKTTGETKDIELIIKTIQQVQKTFGKGAEARQQFQAIAQPTGWSLTPEQLVPIWNLAGKNLPKSEYVKQMKEIGAKRIQKGAEKVEAGPSGIGAQRMIQRQNLILDYGSKFAKASFQMETAMIDFTKNAMPAVATAMDGFGSGLNMLIQGVEDLVNIIKKLREGGLWSTIFGE